ncbi:MAG: NupC/NupG family nucleoside CNT transporter, partial [Pirellulales bacterium]|nr:NupC/NupG family nucleoside CNT transporter [Pirellulales bacterium]
MPTERIISFCGLIVMMLVAWALSYDRSKMNFRLIVSGVVLQLVIGLLILCTGPGEYVFSFTRNLMLGLIGCSDEGSKFVFGTFFFEAPFERPPFAYTVLPTVIFFSTLTAVLFHLGVLQFVVRVMARVMIWVMDTSGSESLCASANVFVGITTAPLVIRPYIANMTRSELMAMMTGGMATAAGGPLAAYVAMGLDAGHLMVASLMAAPASLVIAKIMVPETQESETKGVVKAEVPRQDTNVLDAACRGAGEGLKLSLNIAAMIIAFIALVYLFNWTLAGAWNGYQWLADSCGLARLPDEPITLQWILGWFFAPVAWIMGIQWQDARAVGMLLGEKTVFNEFIAYYHLTTEVKDTISPRSFVIATYALCGFANFGSIAIMIGGIGGLVPSRRQDFARMGLRS